MKINRTSMLVRPYRRTIQFQRACECGGRFMVRAESRAHGPKKCPTCRKAAYDKHRRQNIERGVGFTAKMAAFEADEASRLEVESHHALAVKLLVRRG